MAFLKINLNSLVDPEIELEDLDFEYCLPRAFWTNNEWYKYNTKRKELLDKIKDSLREDELYLQSLEFK